jgi:hypothetical protein
MFAGVSPSGEVGSEQALPICDVGVLGIKVKGAFEVHVMDSPASVVSASPVTSSHPVAALPFPSVTWTLVILTVVVPEPV